MKSKRKTFLKCGGASLVTVLIPLFLIQQPVLSQELKESATEDISIETVEINTVTSFANEFEITDDGVLAKDKAAEMLERYPTLNANPYALLVKFDDLATPEEVDDLLSQTNSIIVDFYPTVNWYLVETPSGNLNTQKTFEKSSIVEEVSIDSVIRADSVNTNDPLIGDVWGLDGNHGVDASVAWPLSAGAAEVIVAVIDSGIDPNHPDLIDAIWVNSDEVPDNGIDDDNNGFVDDTYGWDFTGEYDNTPQDEHGHGTHVAGTIAATRNNNEGIAGVADNVKIMGLRFLDKQGNGITSWAINAIEYAVANGAAISNNSWGGGPYETPLYNAIAESGNAGHLFVAAAGNSGNNSDLFPMYPAAYNLPNILSIAAINSSGSLAGFSNYGNSTVDIAAPGVNILSTMSGESENCPVLGTPCYVSWQGTSMAAPHATGIAALMLGINTGLSPEDIIQIMGDTARPSTALNGKVRFNGELDGGAALSEAASSGSINFIGYSPGQNIIQGATISLTAIAIDADGTDLSSNITWKDENDSVLETGASIDFLADTVGLLSLKAEVISNQGDTFQKTAYFNITAPSVTFTGGHSITRATPGQQINVDWVWEGPDGEVQELNAVSLTKVQAEADATNQYPLPDLRTPVEISMNSTNPGTILDVMLGVRINHTWPADLTMTLIHPDGTEVTLTDHNGNGSHRDGTEVWGEGSRSCNGDLAYFSQTATQSIIDRSKPFTGFSRPVDNLNILEGKDAAGDWTLRIVDGWAQDDGELFCAQLLLATSNPDTTEIIDSQTSMNDETAIWNLPDPFTFSGIYGFNFPQTSLGQTFGGCCVQIGLPAAPSGVEATRTDSQITVTWTTADASTMSDPITGYVVDAYKSSNNQINAGSCVTVTLTCSITGLLPGYDYDIKVRSVNQTGTSDPISYSLPVFENIFNQGKSNLKETPETNDKFGAVIASGNFNNDDNYDLVIGAPNETSQAGPNEGAAHLVYSFPSLSENALITRNSSNTPQGSDANFGSAVAAGDFNGDGFDDLIVGSPGESVNGLENAGAIQIFYGTANGLETAEVLHQDTNWVAGIAHADDRFGAALAVGDMDADGYDDLVVGVPGEYYWPNNRFCTIRGADACGHVGAINVIYGSPTGLSGWDDHYFGQNTSRVAGIAHVDDEFGAAVAVGDIDGDGYDDVVVGSPQEYYWPNARYCARYSCGQVGAINVLYGSADGVTTTDDHYFAQNSSRVAGRSEVGDRFGAALAVGDIDADGFADVVIGAPDDNYRPSNYYCRVRGTSACGNVGAVNILYGTANGLNAAGDQFFNQNSSGIEELAQTGDEFGAALSLGDLNSDGFLDLVIGAPGETINGHNDAGATHILYGNANGISAAGDEILHVDQDAFTGNAETNGHFGAAVLITLGDIIIGSPGATISGAPNAGAIYYLSS